MANQQRPRWRVLAVLPDSRPGAPTGFDAADHTAVHELVEGSVAAELNILHHPTMEVFEAKLQQINPNIVYMAGAFTPLPSNKNDGRLGQLHFSVGPEADAAVGSPQELTMILQQRANTVELVYLDASVRHDQGEMLRNAGIPTVVAWPGGTFPPALAASQFAHSFFAMLRQPSTTIQEAFAMSSNVVQVQVSGASNGSEARSSASVSQPVLLSDFPSTLPDSSSIPAPDLEGVDVSQGLAAVIPGWADVRLLAPRSELRLLLCGNTSVVTAQRLGHLGEAIRALLVLETRQATLLKMNQCEKTPVHMPAGCIAVKCEVRTTSGARAHVVLGGQPSVLGSHMLVEHALRQTLVADSLSLQFRLPPPGVTPPLPRSAVTVAGGCPVVDTLVLTSVWAVAVLRALGQDPTFRGLVALGVAAVGTSIVPNFTPSDTLRHHTLAAGIRPDQYPISNGTLSAGPSPGIGAPNISTIRTSGGAPQPAATTNSAGTAGAPVPSPATTENGLMNVALNPFMHQRTSDMNHTFDYPSASHQVNQHMQTLGYKSKRTSPISTLAEEEFLADLLYFTQLRRGRAVEASKFPEAVLNGITLDLFNLYREVVQRGGYRVSNGINWKGQIFSKMRNWTPNNKMTGVGNALKRHYQNYLLEYEMCHPEDVTGDRCALCGGSDETGSDWVACDSCDAWVHFSCDRRPNLGTFKEYSQGLGGRTYACQTCTDLKRGRAAGMAATGIPMGTQGPMASSSPMVMQGPMASSSPMVTQGPMASSSPMVTQGPMASSSPMVTQGPMPGQVSSGAPAGNLSRTHSGGIPGPVSSSSMPAMSAGMSPIVSSAGMPSGLRAPGSASMTEMIPSAGLPDVVMSAPMSVDMPSVEAAAFGGAESMQS